MDKIRVTQVKSLISQKKSNRKVMQSLGLRKIGSTNILNDNNCIRGMVNKVAHLVRYELIQEDKG